MSLSPAVLSFAHQHRGLVTLRVWTEAGHSRSSFQRWVRSGQLQPVMRGVAALPGTVLRPVHDVVAAVLLLGPDVIVSNRTSAWRWGADIVPRRPVELISTRADRRTRLPGVLLHHPDDRMLLRPRIVGGLPLTAPVRTLLDVGASDPDAVVPTLEALVRNGLTTVPAVLAALERRRRRGRPGIRPLERAIEDLGGVVTDSELENVMRRLFRRTRIGGWTFHELVDGYEVDFCFPAHRVVVEVDGWLFHAARRDRWEYYLERDAHLQASGWLIAHYSWRMLTRRPDRCADLLRATLRQRPASSRKI